MNIIKSAKEFGSKHGSTLCVIGSILGLGATIYETWVTRPKVDVILGEQRAKKVAIETDESLTEEEKAKKRKEVNRETFKRVGVAVIPMSVAGTATCGLTVASKVIDSEKIRDMTATIALGETAYSKLESKTRELLGQKQLEDIKGQVAKDELEEEVDWIEPGLDIDLSGVERGSGPANQLFYDITFRRLFLSDEDTITKAAMELNSRMVTGSDRYFVYNDFYSEIGVRQAPGADYCGWGLDSPDATRLELNLHNTLKLGKRSVIILDWISRPTSRYKGLY